MSVRRLAEVQPDSFAFTPDNEAWAEGIIAKYPEGRQASAVISLLWRAQAQNDYWLPRAAIEAVARKLGMPYIRVLEVATFYTMFNLAPVGEHFIQLCGTTPCQLRGSDGLKAVLRERVGDSGQVTADGKFSWIEVECLGACCNAPMVQINDDYYEDLTPENFGKLLDDLAAGRPVKIGSQTGRVSSEPTGGLTSLTTLYGVDGVSGPQSRAATEAAAQALEQETPPAPQADAAPLAGEVEKVAQEHAEHVGKPESVGAALAPRTEVDPPEKPAAEPPSDAKA